MVVVILFLLKCFYRSVYPNTVQKIVGLIEEYNFQRKFNSQTTLILIYGTAGAC